MQKSYTSDSSGGKVLTGRNIYYNGRIEKVFDNPPSISSSQSDKVKGKSNSVGQEPSTKNVLKQQSQKEATRKSLEMIHGSLSIMPDVDFRARNVYKLVGLGGIFDGKYYVEQCTHSISRSGYVVNSSLIKVDKASLEYYKGSRREPVTNKVSTSKYASKSGEITKSVAEKNNTSESTLNSLNKKRGSHNIYITCPY